MSKPTNGSPSDTSSRAGSGVRPLSPRALTISWIRLACYVVALLLLAAVLAVGTRLSGSVEVPWWPLPLAAGLVAAVGLWWVPLEHRRWRWRLTDELFEVRHGVVIHTVATVPRSRIQNVTTAAGPLQARLGLVTVSVHTAGMRTPSVSIRDLDSDDADWLRHELRQG